MDPLGVYSCHARILARLLSLLCRALLHTSGITQAYHCVQASICKLFHLTQTHILTKGDVGRTASAFLSDSQDS